MDNLAKAVELLPGDETLLDLEGHAREGLFSEPGLLDFIVGKPEEGVGQEGEEASAEPEAPNLERIPEGL